MDGWVDGRTDGWMDIYFLLNSRRLTTALRNIGTDRCASPLALTALCAVLKVFRFA